MSVITIRVTKEIKEKLEKYNVNVSETVRKFLEKYLVELELRDLGERLDRLKEQLGNRIDPKLVAKLVREDREAH
ncbi:MAG: antitoxin [Candidatus Brockarchaeota archaeon]|nr:antitoxin [Candidatus Brockarchaeota archaeon]MBO3767767.1 antitoxin [Candidatus Brockarchaeota archaeon]MBO3801196.1 antitoxin [Candidatus Brockarchaeota archaeon]